MLETMRRSGLKLLQKQDLLTLGVERLVESKFVEGEVSEEIRGPNIHIQIAAFLDSRLSEGARAKGRQVQELKGRVGKLEMGVAGPQVGVGRFDPGVLGLFFKSFLLRSGVCAPHGFAEGDRRPGKQG